MSTHRLLPPTKVLPSPHSITWAQVVPSTSICTPVHASHVRTSTSLLRIYRPLNPRPPNPISQLSCCGATDQLSAARNITAPADSHARRDLRATRYAAQSHGQCHILAATIRVRLARRSKSDRSRIQIGIGGMSSASSRLSLRYVDSCRPRSPAPPLPLPSHHSAPLVLLAAAASSVPPCMPASEPAPIVAAATPAPAPAPTVPASRLDTSPAPHALVQPP